VLKKTAKLNQSFSIENDDDVDEGPRENILQPEVSSKHVFSIELPSLSVNNNEAIPRRQADLDKPLIKPKTKRLVKKKKASS